MTPGTLTTIDLEKEWCLMWNSPEDMGWDPLRTTSNWVRSGDKVLVMKVAERCGDQIAWVLGPGAAVGWMYCDDLVDGCQKWP